MRAYPFSLLCLCMVLFLSFSHVPPSDMGSVTDIDKFVHFGMYFGTASTIWWERLKLTGREDWRWLLPLAVAGPILLSGLIEILQSTLTTYRGGDAMDFLANTLGVVAAAALGHFVLFPIFRD